MRLITSPIATVLVLLFLAGCSASTTGLTPLQPATYIITPPPTAEHIAVCRSEAERMATRQELTLFALGLVVLPTNVGTFDPGPSLYRRAVAYAICLEDRGYVVTPSPRKMVENFPPDPK